LATIPGRAADSHSISQLHKDITSTQKCRLVTTTEEAVQTVGKSLYVRIAVVNPLFGP
jgi:hypothetical protein